MARGPESSGTGRAWLRVLRGCLVGLGGAGLALALWLPGLLETFEARSWDLRARAFARPGPASGEIALVLLDQESLDWGESEMYPWPWPRELFGVVADFCRRAGAKALVYDVLYTEPSFWGVEDDTRFARAVAAEGRVVGTVQLGSGQGSTATWPDDIPRPAFTVEGLDEWLASAKPRGLVYDQATFPIPEFGGAANILGNVNLASDRDGVYRRSPLFTLFNGTPVPAMGLAAWIATNPTAPAISVDPGRLTVGGRSVPIDRDGNAILRFRGPTKTHQPWRAAAIIRSEIQITNGETPEVNPSVLRNKYVFFGYTAPGLFDLRPTPMPKAYPGVEVHATMLDNLLSGDFLRDVPLPLGIALLVLLCLAAGIAVSSVSGALRNALVYVVFVPLAPALAFGAYSLGMWLQLVALETGAVVTLVAANLVNYATEGRQKRFIKATFKQYLSPALIERIVASGEPPRLGGERRELSIFFSDLEDFTGLSEILDAAVLERLLNDYLSPMTDIILEEGGTLDKYIGDAIVAFWNAPFSQDDHPVRAVRAALRCQARLAELRPGFRERAGRDLRSRIGCNTGTVAVGNYGSRTRFSYTMIGDAVNLASRLEGANKEFGTYTMVSATTVEQLGSGFPARELARLRVKGRKEPVVVYEPMTAEQFAARRQVLESFAQGLSAYYGGRFGEAERAFSAIATDDPPAAAYAEKCRELAAGPLTEPWAGVWVMTSK